MSAELGEPLAGSAATHSAWLLLEQPGAWGRNAIVESDLDQELGAELEGRTAGTGVRIGLIRRPGTNQEHAPKHRRWFAASTHPQRTWLATGLVEYPTDLLRIDFAALDEGSKQAVKDLDHELSHEPLMMVCSNGKRDQCCATLGRKVAVSADALDREACGQGLTPAIWEITHIGGHRFAPAAVLLPHGYLYGRIDAALALRILHDARKDLVVLDGCRGRSAWSRPGQAAELAVRAEIGDRAISSLTVTSVEQTAPDPAPSWTVVVEHEDDRAFEVSVTGALADVPRPESCGKAEGTPLELRVRAIDKIR
jgi:hypothetical protein